MRVITDEKRQQDEALRDAIINGDEDALQRFYERFFSRLYRYIYYRVGHDHHHAEEVVNDTFVEAVDKMDRYDPERGSMKAWLITTSRNRIRSNNAKMGRARDYETTWGMLEGELDTIFADLDDENQQIAALEREELADFVGTVMGSLPEEYSKLLEMKYISDLSTREMAGILEKTEKAVESKLTRARAAFKQVFASTATTQTPPPV